MPSLSIRLKALRAFSFPVSAIPVVIATALARPFTEWDFGVLIASALGVVLLHAAGNLLNDYFDFRSGVDRKVEGDEGRPGRFLVRGQLQPRDVLMQALLCLGLLFPLAVYLIVRCGPQLAWFGAVAVVLLYAYTGAPFQLKYRAMGESVIFLVFGPVLMLGAAYAQTGRLLPSVAMLSVPVGIATTAVLVGNNLRDLDEDGGAGITTVARLLGPKLFEKLYVFSLVAPPALVVVLVALGMLPIGTLLGAVGIIPALLLLKSVRSAGRLPDIDARTAQFATLFFILLLTGLVVQGFAGPLC